MIRTNSSNHWKLYIIRWHQYFQVKMSGLHTAQPLCGTLTYDFHFIRGVDFPRAIGDSAGVSAAVLWRQVLQAQSPLLLTALADLLLRERPVVLQPHDVWSRISTGRAFEAH